jgi:hypothetical protein
MGGICNMKQFLKKIGNTMTALGVGIMSMFGTALVATPVAADNILDNISMDSNGNLNTGSLGSSDTSGTFTTLYSKYKTILNGVIGLVTITLVLLFVIQCAKLGASADNAAKRSNSVGALLWIGVAAGLLGSVYTFIGLFYNLFNG